MQALRTQRASCWRDQRRNDAAGALVRVQSPRLLRSAAPRVAPQQQQQQQRGSPVYGLGKDAMDGWLDLTHLVAGSGGAKTPYEDFAAAIGRCVYVDIAGWHLYLRDMGVPGSSLKMSQALAQQLGPQLNKGLREADVEGLLRKVPVKLGAGKLKASLYDVMPSFCVGDLVRLCDEFSRR